LGLAAISGDAAEGKSAGPGVGECRRRVVDLGGELESRSSVETRVRPESRMNQGRSMFFMESRNIERQKVTLWRKRVIVPAFGSDERRI
jgi:hypothetical protein